MAASFSGFATAFHPESLVATTLDAAQSLNKVEDQEFDKTPYVS